MVFSICSFEVINDAVQNRKQNLWILTSAAAVNWSDIKTLLANCFIIFFINGKSNFSNETRGLPRGPLDFTILDSWVLIIFY